MKIRLLSLSDFVAEGHGLELDREKHPPLKTAIPLKSFTDSSEIKIKPYQARDDVLLRIPEAVVGYYGIVRCADVVLDLNNHYDTGLLTQHKSKGFALRRSFFSGYQMDSGARQFKLKSACYMVAHSNYAAWLLGEVPRLKHYEAILRTGVKLALHGQIDPYHLETLELYGVPSDAIVTIPVEADLVISECYFASPTSSYHIPSPAGVRYLSQIKAVIDGLDRFKGGQFYISRSHVAARKIENEIEIQEHLVKKKFVTLHPEQLSLVDQIRLFSGAKTIVTPFGATLANMAFSSGKTEVCVIRTKFTNEFARLAHMTGVRLFVFDSMTRWRHGIRFSKLNKELHQRFRINIEDLSQFVIEGA